MSCLVSKLPFKSNLNFLESDAKISKSSKDIGESHCNRWLHIADSLTYLIRFPVKFEVPMCSDALVKKCGNVFSVLSNLAVTTRIVVDYSREDFFSRYSLNLNKLPSLQMDLKNNIKLTKWYIFLNCASRRALKVIPKFIYFKVSNKQLQSSAAHITCQKRLLNQEILSKQNDDLMIF